MNLSGSGLWAGLESRFQMPPPPRSINFTVMTQVIEVCGTDALWTFICEIVILIAGWWMVVMDILLADGLSSDRSFVESLVQPQSSDL